MTKFEYKVVPAPKRGEKVKGVKTGEGRFAHTLESLMNELGAQGWEYQRADTLPSEERSGFTSKTTIYQNVLVFRRELEPDDAIVAPVPSPKVEPEAAKLIKQAEEPGKAPPIGPAITPNTPGKDKSTDGSDLAAE